VISVEDWALIRRLVAAGVRRRQVARQLGIGRATVDRAVASDRPPKYERKPAPTAFTPFEARVRAILSEHPEMPATVIAERAGWSGSITWFRDNVRRLRPEHRRPDPADRLVWEAGDAAQCDLWFPPKRIPLEDGSTALLPVLVMVAAHSRFVTGRMLPARRTEDLLLGSRELIGQPRDRRRTGSRSRQRALVSPSRSSLNRNRRACIDFGPRVTADELEVVDDLVKAAVTARPKAMWSL
jgi:Helix-turn-helix domain of resolvase